MAIQSAPYHLTFFLLLCFGTISSFGDVRWNAVSFNGGEFPSPREHQASASVAESGIVYVSGGVNSSGDAQDDLWLFTAASSAWRKIDASGPSPTARACHTLTPRANGEFLLFGGFGSSSSIIFNDLWILRPMSRNDTGYKSDWESVRWEIQTPVSVSPSPRWGHAADSVTSAGLTHTLIFGGMKSDGNVTDELWMFSSNSTWTLLTSGALSPPPRYGHTATTFQTICIIFGGFGSDSRPLDDAWSYSFQIQKWTFLRPSTSGIPARGWHGAVPMSDRILLVVGGEGPGGGGVASVLRDSWKFDINFATALPSPSAPPALSRAVLAKSGEGAAINTFGREDSGRLAAGGYYEFSTEKMVWEKRTTEENSPANRIGGVGAIFDQEMIIFGGQKTFGIFGGGALSDMWMFDGGHGRWRQVPSSQIWPSARSYASSILLPPSYLVVFAGVGPMKSYFNDIWFWDFSRKKWLTGAASTPHLPQGRSGHSADLTDSTSMIVFGGSNGLVVLNELWRIDLSPLAPNTPDGDSMLSFDGENDFATTSPITKIPTQSRRDSRGRALLQTTSEISTTTTTGVTSDGSTGTSVVTNLTDTTTAPSTSGNTTLLETSTSIPPASSSPSPLSTTPPLSTTTAGGFSTQNSSTYSRVALYTPNGLLPSLGGRMTIEFAIQFKSVAKTQTTILDLNSILASLSPNLPPFLRIESFNGKIFATEILLSKARAEIERDIQDGQWHHVAVTTSDLPPSSPEVRSNDVNIQIFSGGNCDGTPKESVLAGIVLGSCLNYSGPISFKKPMKFEVKIWGCDRSSQPPAPSPPSPPLLYTCPAGTTCCVPPMNNLNESIGLFTASISGTHVTRGYGRRVNILVDGVASPAAFGENIFSVSDSMIYNLQFGVSHGSYLSVGDSARALPANIDFVRLWREELTVSQLVSNFGKKISPSPASLVAAFYFDGGSVSGGVVADSAGSGIELRLGAEEDSFSPHALSSTYTAEIPTENSNSVSVHEWERIPTSAVWPPARFLHASAIFDGYLVIHGGLAGIPSENSDPPEIFEDCWIFNLNFKIWSKLKFDSSPRMGHTLVIQNSNFLLVGGTSVLANLTPVNTIEVLNPNKMSVENFPAKKIRATISPTTLENSTHMFLFGGEYHGHSTSSFFSISKILPLSDSPPHALSFISTSPPPRLGAVSASAENYLFFCGGLTTSPNNFENIFISSNPSADFLILDTRSNVWKKSNVSVPPTMFSSVAPVLSPVSDFFFIFHFGGVTSGNTMVDAAIYFSAVDPETGIIISSGKISQRKPANPTTTTTFSTDTTTNTTQISTSTTNQQTPTTTNPTNIQTTTTSSIETTATTQISTDTTVHQTTTNTTPQTTTTNPTGTTAPQATTSHASSATGFSSTSSGTNVTAEPSPLYLHATAGGFNDLIFIHGGSTRPLSLVSDPSGTLSISGDGVTGELNVFDGGSCASQLSPPPAAGSTAVCAESFFSVRQFSGPNSRSTPGARVGHTMAFGITYHGPSLLIFGGSMATSPAQLSNSVWVGILAGDSTDDLKVTWSELRTSPSPSLSPSPQIFAGSAVISDGKFFAIFGGYSPPSPPDGRVWVIKIPSDFSAEINWSVLDVSASPRLFSNFIYHNSALWIFNGISSDLKIQRETQKYNLDLPHPKYSFGTLLSLTTAGVSSTFLIFARDIFGSPTSLSSSPENKFEFSFSIHRNFPDENSDGISGSVSRSVSPLNIGEFIGTFTVATAGDYFLSVFLNSDKILSTPLSVVPGKTDSAKCTISSPSLTRTGIFISAAGAEISATIFARDSFSNIAPGGDFVSVFLDARSNPLFVDDNFDGTYSVSLTLKKNGKYFLGVKINNIHISGSPFSIGINPDKPNLNLTYLYGPGLTSATEGSFSFIYVQTVDKFGNNATSADENIFFGLTTNGVLADAPVTKIISYLGRGLYLISFFPLGGGGPFGIFISHNGTVVSPAGNDLGVRRELQKRRSLLSTNITAQILTTAGNTTAIGGTTAAGGSGGTGSGSDTTTASTSPSSGLIISMFSISPNFDYRLWPIVLTPIICLLFALIVKILIIQFKLRYGKGFNYAKQIEKITARRIVPEVTPTIDDPFVVLIQTLFQHKIISMSEILELQNLMDEDDSHLLGAQDFHSRHMDRIVYILKQNILNTRPAISARAVPRPLNFLKPDPYTNPEGVMKIVVPTQNLSEKKETINKYQDMTFFAL